MAVVHAKLGGSFRTELEMGKYRIVADEPASAGGTDEGPTPYDLLGGALASCTAMTLHYYAKREGISLEEVEVTVANDRIHAKDCADCLTGEGYIHRFDVKLSVKGNLTPEQRTRLTEIAKRCPVARTLSSEIKIVHRLV
jgi:uncharacterized OsmC-like protein